MRAPSFKGLRDDKTPEECVLELAGAAPPERPASSAKQSPPKEAPATKSPAKRSAAEERTARSKR
jgi:hypothetical protein